MDLIDKIILLICCFVIYLCEPSFGMNVIPVLAAIVVACFLSYFEKKALKAALTIGFIAASVFLPGLTVFLPLICYDLLFEKFQFFCLAALIPLLFLWQNSGATFIAATVLLSLLCILLKHRTAQLEKLKSDYNSMRDTAREMTLRLNQQNSDLMEKQDYEINIATLNERNRIAREIHDSVGHLLSSSILQVGALLAVNSDEKMKDSLLTVKDTLTQAMESIRSSVHNLYDESIDLYEQMEELVQKFTFCELSFDYDIHSNPDLRLKYAFLAIVKEALANIIRHSDANRAGITFREHPALYQLIIEDNGTVKNYDTGSGIGLKNITDRVDAFHGNINIITDHGFRIFITIPKEAKN
ncbi:sensor histidine kinase [Caproiciproducens faecalis]|uniref:histidine kinase n=1 Tax=Caproiciproducens faecalis TaxID=2820301 RepID=A0ABS7DLJ9_9FIRM|nr:histidine kinase [Caproiciproducens faecalis]MBW7572184.1 sensor histidine kinase [Caproiciproducens faecalis]